MSEKELWKIAMDAYDKEFAANESSSEAWEAAVAAVTWVQHQTTASEFEDKILSAQHALQRISTTYKEDGSRLIHNTQQIIEIANAALEKIK